MSYGNMIFDYPLSFPCEDDSEIEYWPDRHSSRYLAASRMTVDPNQLSQRPNMCHSSRSYNSDGRYHNTNKSHGAVFVSPTSMPQMMTMRPPHAINECVIEQHFGERPQIQLEVRSQASRSQRYYCEFEDCVDPGTGVRRSVSRRADLKRHVHSVHGKPTIDCEYKKCWRRGEDGFCRPDHYREHLRGYHNQELPRTGGRRRNS